MKISVEVSIKGLWLESYQRGYLHQWFPRLRKSQQKLIPLAPGLNIIYGRNGAGKTQLLEAISSVSEYKMSAYEGFVLENPIISDYYYSYPYFDRTYSQLERKSEYSVFAITPQEMYDRYTNMDLEDYWLGYTEGFDPNAAKALHKILILEILNEFINGKHALLTRSPAKDGPSVGDQKIMNPPEFIEIVPMLLPEDVGPITRKHAKEIHESFLNFVKEMNQKYSGGDNPELSVDENNEIYHDETEAKGSHFVSWVAEWSWSPLINVRNLGHDSGFYSFVDDDIPSPLWNAENLPIYLPAIISQSTKEDYEEFGNNTANKSNPLSVMKEESTKSAPEFYQMEWRHDELGDVTFDDIGYENLNSSSLEVDQPQRYEHLKREYSIGLREKLKFLPNFRNLNIRESTYRKHAYLTIHENVLASRGSNAERRWLQLARMAMKEATQWLVIDEPESGLHRSAEADLALTLSSRTWLKDSIVVIATHSPEFLELPSANVLHIDEGSVNTLKHVDRENLLELGLRPADLLTHIRSILLVEGEHERIVFEKIFKEELRRAGCKVIVARGGRKMKDVFESQMIFHFSDASVISLLDNIDSEKISNIWETAKSLANQGDMLQAQEHILKSISKAKSSENTFLSEFLTLALTSGQYERVVAWGLSKPDIIFYFEPINFGIKKTWDELLVQYRGSEMPFKEWATKKYNADFSPNAFENAVRNLEAIPGEFGNLMMSIADFSRSAY